MSRSALAAGVRYLRCQLASQRPSEESDESLLHAFTQRRDESAFAVLMRRHGPMVLQVCRRVLGHEQDAEDVFQATFLVLARNPATLHRKTALAGFLHGTAYRLALTAKRSAARRRKHESQAPPRPPAAPSDELQWREVRTLLDEEIARLPEKYRMPFVLCCLENLSQEEAGRRLGLKERTVSNRLAEARKRLSQRLAYRGVELTALLAGCTLAAQPASALPVGLMAKTIEAALVTATGEGLANALSASVAEMVKGETAAVIGSKTKIATMVLAASMLAGVGAWECRTPALPQAGERPAETPNYSVSPAKPRQDKDAATMLKGRVLRPDGQPAANATIIRRELNESGTALKDTTLTTTGADGRFEVEYQDSTTLIASAPGFAPDWVGQEFTGGELTLTLAERATVRGRLINLEGKPVAGARVKVLALKVPVRGDLNASVDAFRLNPEWTWQALPKTLAVPIPHSTTEAKTDADGRFVLEGLGTNRVLEIRFEAECIESAQVHVILTDNFDPKSVLPRPAERSTFMARKSQPATVYGPRFTHAVRPCQIITGIVTDEVSGKPISGVKVAGTAGTIRALDNTAWHDAVECVTDRDGRYRLNGLAKAKGRHLHVQAGEAPYLDRLIDVPDVTALTPIRMDIKLHKAVVIEGRLVDKTTDNGVRGLAFLLPLVSDALTRFLPDNPAYGGEYSIRPSGMRVFTDAEGRFKLRVPPVPGVILAGADTLRDPSARYAALHVATADRKYLRKPSKDRDGMLKSRRIESVMEQEFFATHFVSHPVHWYNGYALVHPTKKDETVKVVIRFDPGRTLHGKIVGPDGQPLAGVQAVGVQATGERGPTTFRTDSYTVYALDPSRPRTVYFRHERKNLIGTVMLRGDETEVPLVKMQPAAAVIGRVMDRAGKPLAGMEISFQMTEAEPDGLIRHTLFDRAHKRPTTDADGRFRLEGMFPGLEFEVYAGHPGHRSMAVAFKEVTLKAGEVRDLGERRERPER